jgi:hydrogenase/urease accessory protein HupE
MVLNGKGISMIHETMKRTSLSAILFLAAAMPACAHVGIAAGLGLGLRFRGFTRAAGAACAAVGLGLAFGVL